MVKEGITAELSCKVIDGMRDILRQDPHVHSATVRVDFRAEPDLSKSGFVKINHNYQDQ
jgi:hypothetical protein